ncbi:esterase/lipase/thioesterase [Coccidioides immitis H538.4]|uniref:Esterase/lipase/thioesterase n=1 Tax=Coccidioides immitis H538.4 TaxID=396776 RepID=A0A0J8RM73_COCIT|nr:esterase/lipase/thioesterase [Coccidioides immitis H538.4]
MRMPEPPYPLHESVRDLIDPEYAAFYNEHIIDKQQVHYQPIAVSRASGILIPGAGPMIPVGKTQDLAIKRQESKGPALRQYGQMPWVDAPVYEAPENPYPAAVDESWEPVLRKHGEGRELLNVDTSRIGVGGSSAGGNLAAIMAHRSVARNLPPLRVQLPNVPVMDNTADIHRTESQRSCLQLGQGRSTTYFKNYIIHHRIEVVQVS